VKTPETLFEKTPCAAPGESGGAPREETPEAIFERMLALGEEWRVSRCAFDPAAGETHLWVEERPAFWPAERARRGQRVISYDHIAEMQWRHLNVFEHRCLLHCRLPRAQRTDGSVYRVHPPWEGLSKHFTKPFEAHALQLLREMTVSAAARALGESDKRLWRMLHTHVSTAYPRLDFSAVTCVGCDEMSVSKGHRYVTVFCDLAGKRVLFACPNRDSATWEKFARALGEHNGHPRAITHVSLDMSPAYMKGIEENIGSQARHIFDKFHIIAKVNMALDEARRAEQKLCGKEHRALLKGARWTLLKNASKLNARQQTQHRNLLATTLGTLKAYQMRLALQKIYGIEEKEKARRKLRAWCRWVRLCAARHKPEILADMVRCSLTFERHIEGILAHWDGRVTNAFMEGLNSVFSAVVRKARGYRSIENLITMLYFHSARLPLPAQLPTPSPGSPSSPTTTR
jgi:transposase